MYSSHGPQTAAVTFGPCTGIDKIGSGIAPKRRNTALESGALRGGTEKGQIAAGPNSREVPKSHEAFTTMGLILNNTS